MASSAPGLLIPGPRWGHPGPHEPHASPTLSLHCMVSETLGLSHQPRNQGDSASRDTCPRSSPEPRCPVGWP